MTYLDENPQEVKNASYYRRQVKKLEEELRLLNADADRYRWLRAQHWSDSELSVVSDPKKHVRIGTYCPSGELLDEAIDNARTVSTDGVRYD